MFFSRFAYSAVSEYQRAYADQIRRWIKGDYVVLGTDGYGRSDTRKNKRFFEISTITLFMHSDCFQKTKRLTNMLKKIKLYLIRRLSGKSRIIDLKIPNLGEAESTEIIEINIKNGAKVELNDPLIVLELKSSYGNPI